MSKGIPGILMPNEKNKVKEDRRITRTRFALKQALTELVAEKGYDAVTVEDITSRANLGRTTFYLHYQDKEDLLLEGLEEKLVSLGNEISKYKLVFWFRERNALLIRSIFDTVKDNQEVFQIATREQSNKLYDRFYNTFLHAINKIMEDSPWGQKFVQRLPVSVEYVVEYFSGSIWASILWWAKEDFKTPSEEMARNFRDLFMPGLLRILKANKLIEMVDVMTP
jgi:AcrR family transcriptional regulator